MKGFLNIARHTVLHWSRLAFVLVFVGVPGHADDPLRQKPVLDREYHGGFPDDYPAELNLVQSMVPNLQLDVSTQLGLLQYNEGFLHPVSVRFADGAPAITQNPFFYVQPSAVEGKPYSQELDANVEAFSRRQK
jgi:hypothetical protein